MSVSETSLLSILDSGNTLRVEWDSGITAFVREIEGKFEMETVGYTDRVYQVGTEYVRDVARSSAKVYVEDDDA